MRCSYNLNECDSPIRHLCQCAQWISQFISLSLSVSCHHFDPRGHWLNNTVSLFIHCCISRPDRFESWLKKGETKYVLKMVLVLCGLPNHSMNRWSHCCFLDLCVIYFCFSFRHSVKVFSFCLLLLLLFSFWCAFLPLHLLLCSY